MRGEQLTAGQLGAQKIATIFLQLPQYFFFRHITYELDPTRKLFKWTIFPIIDGFRQGIDKGCGKKC